MIFALARGPLLSFLSDLQGHFSQWEIGQKLGSYVDYPLNIYELLTVAAGEKGFINSSRRFFSLTLTTIALCSDWLCKKWPSESCFSFEVCFCPTGVNNSVAFLGLKPCIFKGRESNESACLHLN